MNPYPPPHPAYPPHAAPHQPLEPASHARMMTAAGLDQLAMLDALLVVGGAGYLATRALEVPSTAGIVGSAIGALIALFICAFVLYRMLRRRGTSAGLFIVGARFAPRPGQIDADEALNWLAEFWQGVIMLPLHWLFNRAGLNSSTGLVRDPAARRASTRPARLVMALLLLLPPAALLTWLFV